MDAFELLKTDHEKVAGIFEKLAETTERAVKTRTELFAKLKEELDVHAHIEETILYPVLRRESETREITLEGLEEHHVMKLLLRELNAMSSVETEQWTAKLKVLKENVEHHVEEEEGEMFVEARKILSREQIEELGAQLEAEKKTQQQKTAAAGQ